jgi:dTDP-4-dehydrorhamnose reductase
MRVVNDIRMSPTYTVDAARRLEQLIHRGATGIFHLTNEGSCTWYEFARAALDLLGLRTDLHAVPCREYPTKARRPTDSSLVSVRGSGFQADGARPWRDALQAYLIERKYL